MVRSVASFDRNGASRTTRTAVHCGWPRDFLQAIRENPMPATPDDLFAFLDSLGIAHKSVRHPPLFTVEQSRALRGQIPGGHTKNLFLKDKKDALFLVVADEEAHIAPKKLHTPSGASGRFSFGSSDL